MPARPGFYTLVQCVSAARILGALLFSTIAFQPEAKWVAATLYVLSAASDLIDGLLARRFAATSYFGKIVDLIGDKCLTIVSLMYAAVRGISVAAVCLIAIREVTTLGLRLIVVDGQQLLPTNRAFGGIMVTILWGTTFLLLVLVPTNRNMMILNTSFWMCAVILSLNFVMRLVSSAERIKAALRNAQE